MINKVILVGYVGNDPDVQHGENHNRATFSIATNERYKDKSGQQVDEVTWHNIVCWGKLAKIVEEFLKKKMLVAVEGKIKISKYQDKEGNKKESHQIIANNIKMLSSKNEKKYTEETKPTKNIYEAMNQTFDDDDIPF